MLEPDLAKAEPRTAASSDLNNVHAELQKSSGPLRIPHRVAVAKLRGVTTEEDPSRLAAPICDPNVLVGTHDYAPRGGDIRVQIDPERRALPVNPPTSPRRRGLIIGRILAAGRERDRTSQRHPGKHDNRRPAADSALADPQSGKNRLDNPHRQEPIAFRHRRRTFADRRPQRFALRSIKPRKRWRPLRTGHPLRRGAPGSH